jgi:hypothetical protein
MKAKPPPTPPKEGRKNRDAAIFFEIESIVR